jgi:hypothetical protein
VDIYVPSATKTETPHNHRVCLTLDQKTLDVIAALQRRARGRRSATVREIIQAAKDEIARGVLIEFYRDMWIRLVSHRENKIMTRFDWPAELNDVLYILAMAIFDRDNRREMFRLLVTFYGLKAGVVQIVPQTVYNLKLPSSAKQR